MKFIELFAAPVYQPDTSILPKPSADMTQLDMVLGIVFAILGAIAVLVIVLAGVKYIIARGEPREMAQARNMIIYALIGLAVCILAYSIVTFVVKVI